MSYPSRDKTFSGKLPQWLFLQDFQPVTGEEATQTRMGLKAFT